MFCSEIGELRSLQTNTHTRSGWFPKLVVPLKASTKAHRIKKNTHPAWTTNVFLTDIHYTHRWTETVQLSWLLWCSPVWTGFCPSAALAGGFQLLLAVNWMWSNHLTLERTGVNPDTETAATSSTSLSPVRSHAQTHFLFFLSSSSHLVSLLLFYHIFCHQCISQNLSLFGT